MKKYGGQHWQSLDADATERLLAALVQAGWLHLAITVTGGRPSRRWEVNPKLMTEPAAESAESPKRGGISNS